MLIRHFAELLTLDFGRKCGYRIKNICLFWACAWDWWQLPGGKICSRGQEKDQWGDSFIAMFSCLFHFEKRLRKVCICVTFINKRHPPTLILNIFIITWTRSKMYSQNVKFILNIWSQCDKSNADFYFRCFYIEKAPINIFKIGRRGL